MINNALHAYGQFKAYLGVFISIIFAVILVLVSRYITNRKFVNETMATVTNVSGKNVETKITVNGTEYTKIFTMDPPPAANSKFKVYYNNDPLPEFSTFGNPPAFVGPAMIGFAIFIVVISIVIAYFVTVSKPLGAVYGGAQAVGNVMPSQ